MLSLAKKKRKMKCKKILAYNNEYVTHDLTQNKWNIIATGSQAQAGGKAAEK